MFNRNRISFYLGILIAGHATVGTGAQTATAEGLKIAKSESTLRVRSGERDLVTYNVASPPVPTGVDPVFERSGFLHPVNTLLGGCVTATFPADHEHQHGIFSAWTRTTYDGQLTDFWNLAHKTGRVRHEKISNIVETGDKAIIEVDLLHQAIGKSVTDVLREHWKITVYPPAANCYWFDIESTQNPLTDKPLHIEQYIYGGQGYRGPVGWLQPEDDYAKMHPEHHWSGAIMRTSERQGRIEGNHTHVKWAAIQGQPVAADGLTRVSIDQPSTLAILSHASNFRFPQAVRLHPTKPYFSYSPCVDGPFVIEKPNAYTSKFRYVVIDGPIDENWIDQQWKIWNDEPR